MNCHRHEIELEIKDALVAKLLEDPRLVITVGEAAVILGVSRSFAYQLVRQGELRVIQLGRRKVVPKIAVLDLVGLSVCDDGHASGEQA
jgi:excisionase family DNA binding protein